MKTTKVFVAFALGCALTSCINKDLYEGAPQQTTRELLPESDYPDFSTTSDVQFNVRYGALGQRALIEIFSEEPELSYSLESGQTVKGTPIYKIFTNAEGAIQGTITLPSYVEKVYFHTEALGIPHFAEASVVDGKVELDLTPTVPSAARNARTRGEEESTHKLWDLGKVGPFNHLYSIVGWEGNAYGKITDDNGGLLTYGTFSAEDLRIIKPYLGNATSSEFSKHLVSSDVVNTTIAPTFVNEKGETMTTESAQIYVTYVGEMGAWYQDGLGYYYYKTGEAPATRAEAQAQLKHYMIIPNTSLAGDPPYIDKGVGSMNGYYNYGAENAPAWVNERVQLLFEDPETGLLSTHFPPGYTIGFFQVSKAHWGKNSCADPTWKVGLEQLWYSNEEWNTDNRKRHFSALGYKDKILYGVEDGQNTSYNDLVFSVEADPTGAVQDKGRYDIIEVEPEEDATEVTTKSYAFEDIWPTGGDYDLNDVIVEHTRSVTFDSYNYLKEVIDTFVAVQPVGSATYRDGFGIQIPSSLRGNMVLPAGATDEQETGSIILFSSAKDVRGVPFIIKRTFSGKQATKVGLEADDYNPFIISQYNPSEPTRTEIHLPKHQATSKADVTLIGTEDDAYFINKDGLHPFAVMMPIRGFVPVTEQKSVETDYPYFKAWAESKMTSYQGWYLWHK